MDSETGLLFSQTPLASGTGIMLIALLVQVPMLFGIPRCQTRRRETSDSK